MMASAPPPHHPRFLVLLSETAVMFVQKSLVMMGRQRRRLLSGIILAVVILLISRPITVTTNALQINQHQHQHHQHQQFRASSLLSSSSSPYILSSSSSSLFMSKKEEEEETSSSLPSPSSSGLSWNKFPFFATQQQESSQEQLKEGQRGGAASAAAITTRLPIGKLFDASRDYIFNTATNVRGYEWTKKETEELLDDLMDAAEQERETDYDYELNQIVLIPMEWDREALGLGNRYDVYDGQQRLVTLCLIFAGIRQFLLQFNNSDNNDNDMEETTKELADMLSPPKTRKQDVVRIELNNRDNEILSYILTGDLEQVQAIVSHHYTQQQLTKKYSNSNRQILSNYQVIMARLSALEDSDVESNSKNSSLFTKDYVLQLLDFIIEKVYLLVCIPESAAIARNIVMGQGKGKDNEIIDDFKGLVCFRYTQDEQSMYKTFDAWDDLSSSCSSMIDLDSGIVGRDVVTNACLWRATSFLKTKIGKRNQLLCLEKWMRGNIMQSRNGYQDCSGGGDQFFLKQIKPASVVLGYFRDGSLPPQLNLPLKTKSDNNKLLMAKIEISLRFLRDLVMDVSAATKEIEMIVLELLLRATNRNKKMPLQVLHQHLLATEQLVLYFALLKPSASVKYKKCFELLDRIEDQASSSSSSSIVPSSTHLMKSLWEEQKVELRNALVLNDFGATAGGKKFAVALLKRLNRDVMIQQSGEHFSSDRMMKQVLFGGDKNTYLEPVLPPKATKKAWGGVDSWPEKIQREKSIPKLGNLCLVGRTDHKKPTTKELKSSFEEKKGRYKEEMWPLTSRLASIDTWNDNSMTQTTAVLIGLVNSIWGLPLD